MNRIGVKKIEEKLIKSDKNLVIFFFKKNGFVAKK